MNRFSSRFSLILLLTLLTGPWAGNIHASADSADLKAINPFNEKAMDFLDRDLKSTLFRGHDEFRRARYLEAARYYLYVLRHDSDNADLMFMLSRCYARLHRPALAARMLLRAVNAGFTNMEAIRSAKAFSPLLSNPAFRKNRSRILNHGKSHGNQAFVISRRLEPVRIHLPRGYTPRKSYTLLIGMHGNGDNGTNFARIWRHFGRQDFIFVVPRGAYEKSYSAIVPGLRFSWDMETRDKSLWKIADALVIKNILEVQDYMARRHKIRDTYLLGFSQGAAYTYATAIRHPDRFRGIICFAGILPPMDKPWSLFTRENLKAAAKLRVFIAHGKKDGAGSERIHATLTQLGYNAQFHSFDDGHVLPPRMLRKAADWMMRESPGRIKNKE